MLSIIFCTNPELDAQLANQTQRIVSGTHIKVITDGISYQPDDLLRALRFRYLSDPVAEGLVVALTDTYPDISGQELALQVRAIFKDAYIIYFSEKPEDLLFLTNQHVRLSGYIMSPLYEEAYTKTIALVHNDFMRGQLKKDRQFSLVVGKQLHTFLMDEIIYFESLNKKINIVTAGRAMEFYESLANLENRLKVQFIRCHNSFLVNMKHIRKISLNDLEITLSKHIRVPISQKYKGDVIQLIEAYRP